jgi:tripartite-type tricarboxylate transporter receptor subunit TctC
MIKKIIIALCSVLIAASVNSQTITPLTLVVPLGVGSSTDTLARFLASELTKQGTPTVVVNKPGADKVIGVNYVATSPADGKTLLVGSSGDVTLLPLYNEPGLKFNEHTFVPISYLASATPVLTANPKLPANNLSELIKLIKANPEKYPVGSFGKSSDLQAHAIFKIAGVTPTLIPYKGTLQSATDTVGGNLALGIQPLPVVQELVKGKKLKIIASLGEHRDKNFPGVGTVSELNGYHSTYWFGIFAPPGINPEVAKQLNYSINEAMKSKTVTKQLSELSYNTQSMTLDQFDAFYAYQVRRTKSLIAQSKAQKE